MMATKKPGVKVRVLFDYDYTNAQGTKISIKVGEECLLLKKSTEEWWSVVREKEKKPIYVPANYVEEIKAQPPTPVPAERPKKKGPPPKPPTKPKPPKPSIAEDEALKELDEVINSALDLNMLVPDEDTIDETTEPGKVETTKQNVQDFNDNDPCYDIPIPVRGQDSDEEPEPDYDEEGPSPGPKNEETTLRSTCSTGDSAIGSQDSLDNVVPHTDKGEELPDYANVGDFGVELGPKKQEAQEEDDGPDYANLSDIQAVIQNSPSQSVEESSSLIRELENDWQLRQDNKTKKYFRYHRVSKELLWNDPREVSSSPGGSLDRKSVHSTASVTRRPEVLRVNSFGTPFTLNGSTSEQLSPLEEDTSSSLPSPIPSGWREESLEGEVFMVNDVTEEKWRRAVDGSGRTYYYRKEGGETVWELPEVTKRHSSLDSGGIADIQRKILAQHSVRASWSVGDTSILRKIPVPLAQRDGSVIQEEDESRDRVSALYDISPTSTAASTLTRLQEKNGTLYKTKCTENGKKIKKNWSQSFAVLRGGGLYFYKDQKSTQSTGKHPNGKYDFSIGLRGCKISSDTKDRSSRKHTAVLTTSGGVEFLLQDSSAQGIKSWCTVIASNITSSMVSLSGSVNSLDELNVESPTGNPEPSKIPQRPTTPDDLLPSGEKNSKFKEWINKWLKNRPSYESVKEKGYIKDGVFGSHLQTLYDRTKTAVPVFVCCCVEAIEKRGLKVDGIFRVGGNLAHIQKLRFLVDKDEHYDLTNAEWDIHVVTGALKLFFRELDEPLVPFTFFDKFIDAVQIKDRSKRLKTFKDLIKVLPTPNRETLKVLCAHLNRVIEHSRVNRMQLQNIAIVFGPTLMWPATESQNLAISMVYQGQCIEFIIQEHKLLF